MGQVWKYHKRMKNLAFQDLILKSKVVLDHILSFRHAELKSVEMADKTG